MTIGIVMIVQCTLGTTPIASLTYVLSINTSLSIGIWMFMFNSCLIIGQLLLFGKHITTKDKIEILLQIPSAIIFSIFRDLSMYLFRNVAPIDYATSVLMLLIGCLVQSLGLSISMKPNVTLLSADAFVRYISQKFNKRFSQCKIVFDVSTVVMAVLISLWLSTSIQGVREGTVIAACINGYIVGFFNYRVFTQKNLHRLTKSVLRIDKTK